MEPLLDVSDADWIAPMLRAAYGPVTAVVPSSYPAYVRICHPVEDAAGWPVSWREVAEATGRHAHPTMQWHALIGAEDPFNPQSDLWAGAKPEWGCLDAEVLTLLCTILATHTTTPDDCRFALWEGYGWIQGGRAVGMLAPSTDLAVGGARPQLSAEQLAGPRVEHPDRNYLLFRGSLSSIGELGWQVSADRFDPQSPNMFWPVDRAWFAASEIDFDSTIVAGSVELVDALITAPGIDAWPIGPGDSLAYDADLINT